jgi:hypothetical protein
VVNELLDLGRHASGEPIAALPGLGIVDLDPPAAMSVVRATTWADAHTLYAAQPSPGRPDGAVIATTRPHAWKEQRCAPWTPAPERTSSLPPGVDRTRSHGSASRTELVPGSAVPATAGLR